MKDLEDNINYQVDQILEIETGLKTIQKTVLEILKIETEEQQEDSMVRIGLKTNLETIQMIRVKIVEMILNRNPTNTVIKRGILENTVRSCKPM